MTGSYYISAGRKVGDFLIGLFAIPGLIILITVLLFALGGEAGAFMLAACLALGVIIFCFVKGRYFMGLGAMTSIFLLPLLILGACFLAMS